MIEQGMADANIEVYLVTETNVNGFLVLTRQLQTEGIDWFRTATNIAFVVPPPAGSTVEILYSQKTIVEVDFAVSVPFSQIDGMTTSYVDNLGGLDYSIDLYEGKRIIFAVQEDYPGYILSNDGWIQNRNSWDDGHVWDDPVLGWDNYRVVPGFAENQANDNIANERAGIWKVTVDDTGIYRLVFEEVVVPDQKIYVRYGFTYGGKIVKYGPLPRFDIGESVPRYRVIGARLQGAETIFDGGATRFVDNINIYQGPDEGDKYLMFPRVNIFG